ncbi:MAG: hydrolase [Hellea sp.]|nr:hydrolase [Hellea sp.]
MAHQLNISTAEQSILDEIAGLSGDMISMMVAWSHINSGSRNADGLEKMRAVLCEYFSDLPGTISEPRLAKGELVSEKGVKEPIFYAPAMQLSVRPDAKIQLVLTGHYDTVFPEDSHFQRTRKIDDDTLNGPGVADMKGGIIVMANALKSLEKHPDAMDVGYTVLLSPDEEIGSPGSAPLLAELGAKSDVGLTYEPALADGSMAGARKGSGNFALIIKGRAAHAGREHHLGRNAIAAMAEFTVALEALNGQREGVTFNMAKIDGGGAVNIVPELAIGRFNVRMLESDDMSWIDQQLRKLIETINKRDGLSAELTGGFTRPPKPMAPANAMVFDWVKTAGTLLGQDIRWSPSGGVCEGNNLWASGCPNVDTLGVCGGEIHSDREFVKLSSLTERTRLSTLILMKLASGEYDAKKAKALARSGSNSC